MGYQSYKAARDRQARYEARYAAEKAAHEEYKEEKRREAVWWREKFGPTLGPLLHGVFLFLVVVLALAVCAFLFGTLRHPGPP